MKHRLREIHGENTGAREPIEDKAGKVTCATGEIENSGTVPQSNSFEAEALPLAVHAVGENPGDEVVAGRYRAEHCAHEAWTASLSGWVHESRLILPEQQSSLYRYEEVVPLRLVNAPKTEDLELPSASRHLSAFPTNRPLGAGGWDVGCGQGIYVGVECRP